MDDGAVRYTIQVVIPAVAAEGEPDHLSGHGRTVISSCPHSESANPVLLTLIATGGVLYSGGVFFYALKGFKYHHMVWHLFVNLGALITSWR